MNNIYKRLDEFKCKTCDATFDQQKKMRQHITKKHRTKQVINKTETPRTKERKRKHSNGSQEDVRATKEVMNLKSLKLWI